jgi:pimeloyl-ACP methyl ester carboxylesterase
VQTLVVSVARRMTQYFLSLVPHAENVVLPGVNHFMQMGDPKRVATASADFLSRHRF